MDRAKAERAQGRPPVGPRQTPSDRRPAVRGAQGVSGASGGLGRRNDGVRERAARRPTAAPGRVDQPRAAPVGRRDPAARRTGRAR